MLHARHYLLADITAFGEIHAAELIHVTLVREGIAVFEVGAAARNAKGNAVRLILMGVDCGCAEIRHGVGCGLGGAGATGDIQDWACASPATKQTENESAIKIRSMDLVQT
jgi:hypothetical protein